MNIKKVWRFLAVISLLCVGVCGCGNKQSNDGSVVDSTDTVHEKSTQSASGDPVLEDGSIGLTDSSADFQDYTDIGMGKSCEFQFTVENNSGMELTSAAVCCVILDTDGNILGTADAWIDAHIGDGVSAVAMGQFDYTEYENSAMLKADYGYYDTNGDDNICRIEFSDKDIENTVINLTDSTSDEKIKSYTEYEGQFDEKADVYLEYADACFRQQLTEHEEEYAKASGYQSSAEYTGNLCGTFRQGENYYYVYTMSAEGNSALQYVLIKYDLQTGEVTDATPLQWIQDYLDALK